MLHIRIINIDGIGYPSSISTPSTSFTILSWVCGSLKLELDRLNVSLLFSKLGLELRRFTVLARIPVSAAAIFYNQKREGPKKSDAGNARCKEW
jgi:hypothetical protein